MEHIDYLAGILGGLEERTFNDSSVSLFKKVINPNSQGTFEAGEIYIGEKKTITNWEAVVIETIAIYIHTVEKNAVRYSIVYYEIKEMDSDNHEIQLQAKKYGLDVVQKDYIRESVDYIRPSSEGHPVTGTIKGPLLPVDTTIITTIAIFNENCDDNPWILVNPQVKGELKGWWEK